MANTEKPHFRIGTRGSDLAMWQAHYTRDLLQSKGATVEIIIMKTKGDVIQDVSFDKMEGKGFFTKEIEAALLNNTIDLAVHSHKDLETVQPPGLVVAAVPPRGPHEDLLIVRKDKVDLTTPLQVSRNAVVGTSSMRRKCQLELLQPDVTIEALRGNVPTRIRKLADGKYDAIMLARAGVDRLGIDMSEFHVQVMDATVFVPAPAQGALALQMRESDPRLSFLAEFNDRDTVRAIEMERSILRELEGGCQLPFGAYVPRPSKNVDGALPAPLTVHAYLGGRDGPVRKVWTDVKTADAAENTFPQELVYPNAWPSAFITQDLDASKNHLNAMFTARSAELTGAALISAKLSGVAMPGEAQEGDWVFLGSPKCAELFAASHDLSKYQVAVMGEGTRQALPPKTLVKWTGTGSPISVFEQLAKLAGDQSVWIPHADKSQRRWEGIVPCAKAWHFYDVTPLTITLPKHEVALITSPSNADGYKASGGECPVIAIGDTTAMQARSIGLNVVATATSPLAWGWSQALDAFVGEQTQQKINNMPLLARVAAGGSLKEDEKTPVWCMRQAGRSLPEYLELKGKTPFMEAIRNVELATELTLQPIRRYNVDGAVVYSDILTIPQALGINIEIDAGVVVHNPLKEESDLGSTLSAFDASKLNFVYEIVASVKQALLKENYSNVSVIGFSGAPWTLLTYMLGDQTKDKNTARRYLARQPAKAAELLRLLEDAVIEYLDRQIEAGAHVVQLFDSWAGAVGLEMLRQYMIPGYTRIITTLRARHADIPFILFARGVDASEVAAVPASVVGVDESVDVAKVSASLRNKALPLQGNMDPCTLYGTAADVTAATKRMMTRFHGRPWIANLGHGVPKDVDPAMVQVMIDTIRGK